MYEKQGMESKSIKGNVNWATAIFLIFSAIDKQSFEELKIFSKKLMLYLDVSYKLVYKRYLCSFMILITVFIYISVSTVVSKCEFYYKHCF